MYCRNCGQIVADQAVFCPKCGVPPMSGKSCCWNCGQPTDVLAEVCLKCGVKLTQTQEGKSRLAAGLFGLFLGWIGIHRFYLGYVGIGVVQIIVTFVTFGVGGLWGFIEGIVILAGGWKNDAKGIPLKEM